MSHLPIPLSVLSHLFPPGAFCLGFSSVLPVFPPLSPPPSQDLSIHMTDLWASLPTARRLGGPQDPPLQGEGLQEGETLWYLPAGHHSGGLRLQRFVADGTQDMLLLLDRSGLGQVGSLLGTCACFSSVGDTEHLDDKHTEYVIMCVRW